MNWMGDDELIEKFWREQGGKPNMDADISFYGSSWDMLMPVVEKIESLGHSVRIERDNCDVADVGDADWMGTSHSTKIKATRATVVDFIKWYNQQKEK